MYDYDAQFDTDLQLAMMSDDELHAHACKNSKRKFKWTREEELAWAEELIQYNCQLESFLWDGEVQTIDGCTVEIDGTCPHGYTSPLILLKIIE